MIDIIINLLNKPEQLIVVFNPYYWSGAFDQNKVVVKCIALGTRTSIIKILIDFTTERKMQVKMNKQTS